MLVEVVLDILASCARARARSSGRCNSCGSRRSRTRGRWCLRWRPLTSALVPVLLVAELLHVDALLLVADGHTDRFLQRDSHGRYERLDKI